MFLQVALLMTSVYSRNLGKDEFVWVMRQGRPYAETPLTFERYSWASHALITMGGTNKGIIDRILEKWPDWIYYTKVPAFRSGFSSDCKNLCHPTIS